MADKLERLFGKFGRDQSASRPSSPAYSTTASLFARKGSLTPPSSHSHHTYGKPFNVDDMTFPQPSFIRPKVAKMVPREDRTAPGTRPVTAAGRSMSVGADTTDAAPSLQVIAPARPRNPSKAKNPPVAFNLNSFDSRRSSFNTNNSSATLSSGCSTISSCSGGRHSFVDGEAFGEMDSISNHRGPRRSSSLLQRRDLSLAPLAPLAAFDDYQLPVSQDSQKKSSNNPIRDSVTITINSGEISPSTVLAPTSLPSLPSKPLPSLPPTSLPPLPPKAAQPQIIRLLGEDDTVLAVTSVPETTQTKTTESTESTETETETPAPETPLLNDSVTPPLQSLAAFSPPAALSIALPQSRPSSPAVEPTRRRVRLSRRPMSLRYKRHLPNEPTPSSPSSVLMEPNLGDFLSLSDDDIAEEDEEKSDKSDASIKSPKSAKSPRRVNTSDAPSQPPSFRAPSPSGFAPYSPSFLALLPGMPVSSGGRPRTPAGDSRMAAAFKIAGIASRYQFDLAYIATIWPKNMAYLKSSAVSMASAAAVQSIGWPSSPSAPPAMKLVSRTSSQTSRVRSNRASRVSHVSQKSHASQKSTASFSSTSTHAYAPVAPHKSKLDAQFLAAFGLATVKTPYTLSAPMHHKILNAEQQWTSFGPTSSSSRRGMPQEFSQGFGCAFHQGHAPVMTTFSQQRYERRPSTADDCDADTEQDYYHQRRKNSVASSVSNVSTISVSQSNNRGIVFVAYRRKEVAEERAARGEVDDLEALHRDVEALVQEIHDAHVQQVQAEAQKPRPEAEDILVASLSSLAPTNYNRQSRFLTVRALS